MIAVSPPPICVVVCGVSGCGKSTIAKALAAKLGCAFEEGDDYHSEANKAKMHKGIPLDDDDRQPWLVELHNRAIARRLQSGQSVVLSCSALKRQYRDALRGAPPLPVFFVQIAADQAVIEKRLLARKGHFMPSSLLASQIAIFNPLDPSEEHGVVVDPMLSVEAIVQQVIEALARLPERAAECVHGSPKRMSASSSL